jgi:hypothetical protein
MKAQSNVPDQKLRWTARRAAAEFGVGYHVLSRKLQEAGEIAGEDNLFGTAQITTALYGSLHQARVHKLRADGQRSEMLARALKGELIDRKELTAAFSQLAAGMVGAVENSGMPREAQERFLRELSEWPVVLAEAEHRSRKLRSGNGK